MPDNRTHSTYCYCNKVNNEPSAPFEAQPAVFSTYLGFRRHILGFASQLDDLIEVGHAARRAEGELRGGIASVKSGRAGILNRSHSRSEAAVAASSERTPAAISAERMTLPGLLDVDEGVRSTAGPRDFGKIAVRRNQFLGKNATSSAIDSPPGAPCPLILLPSFLSHWTSALRRTQGAIARNPRHGGRKDSERPARIDSGSAVSWLSLSFCVPSSPLHRYSVRLDQRC